LIERELPSSGPFTGHGGASSVLQNRNGIFKAAAGRPPGRRRSSHPRYGGFNPHPHFWKYKYLKFFFSW